MKQTLSDCLRADNEKMRIAAKTVGDKLFGGDWHKLISDH